MNNGVLDMCTKILELYDSYGSLLLSWTKKQFCLSVNLARWEVNHISASEGYRKLKNGRNVYVYISTEYNIKLQDLYCLRCLQKTDFGTS